MRAWSSSTSGSGSHRPSRSACCGGNPGSNPGSPVDLASDQHAVIEQEVRPALLDDREACALQCLAADGRQLDRIPAGDDQAAAIPEIGVDEHRQARPPHSADEAVQAGGVIGVAVAEHDDLHVARVQAQPAHVGHQRVRAQPGIEQDPVHRGAALDRDQHREAGLGDQPLIHPAALEQRRGPAGGIADERAPGRPRVHGQQVDDVVHQRGDGDGVDRFERDGQHWRDFFRAGRDGDCPGDGAGAGAHAISLDVRTCGGSYSSMVRHTYAVWNPTFNTGRGYGRSALAEVT
jgi:hypothetical protein